MNYFKMNGKIGTWKNKPVYMINKNDYIERKDVIQAIRPEYKGETCVLVYDGEIIGVLESDGNVITQPARKYVVVEEKEREVSFIVENNLTASIDYSKYSHVVDTFFEELKKVAYN